MAKRRCSVSRRTAEGVLTRPGLLTPKKNRLCYGDGDGSWHLMAVRGGEDVMVVSRTRFEKILLEYERFKSGGLECDLMYIHWSQGSRPGGKRCR